MNDELIDNGETENKQKCLNKKCFIIFFISFILIIGLAIFLFFILRGKEEEEECEPGYIPINGKCKLYSFMGTYRNDLIEDKIQLINETYLTYIGEMYMNNEEIDKTFSYNFSSVGNHTIYFYINISSLQSLEGMFEEVKKMVSIKFSPEFNTKNIKNMDRMFSDCNSLISLDLSNFDTSSVTSMDKMFHFCRSLTSLIISSFNTSSVTNMHALFDNCVALTSIDVSNFDTSKVTNMASMFNGCNFLLSLDVSNFDTSSVIYMDTMFYCPSLTSLDVSNFKTSNVISMQSVFAGCVSLTSIDVSNFDTSKVTIMAAMFAICSSLVSLDVSNFDTSNVMIMSSMFSSCESLTSINLSKFNTGKLRAISNLFNNCKKLSYIDISTFHNSLGYDSKIFEKINVSGEIIISKNISSKINNIFEDLNMSWTITEI